jgi:hypothetical protein
MKKNLLSVLLAFIGFITHAQTINVSTGITTTGSSISSPNPDPQWLIVSPTSLPTLVCYGGGFWEPTPVVSTNAGWINTSGAQNYTNLVTGLVTYERLFTVSSTSTNINCNFSVAADDNLISVELVRPDNSTVPLSYVFSGLFLSAPITDIVPVGSMSGTWKIRAVVNYFDAYAGFLLSGNVTMDSVSNCNVLYDGFDDSLSWSHPMTIRTCSTYYNDISISGSKFNFYDARDGHVNVFNKTLPVALSNSSFKADIDLVSTAFGPSGEVSTRILGLSAGPKAIANDESSSTCISTACAFPTMTCQYSPQMALEVRIEGDPTVGYYFILKQNTGAGGYTPLVNLGTISTPVGGLGTFYLSLERTSATTGTFSVYSDFARTNHIPGSPISFSLSSSFGGLNNVQLGVYEGGWHGNRLTGTLDNLCISNTTSTLSCTATASNVVGCPSCSIPLVGSPAGGTFSVPNPYTGPSTTYTYTYTDPVTGCTATSAPATITVSNNIPVTGFHLVSATGSTATFAWDAIPCIAWYTIRYRPLGSSGSWTSSTTGTIPKTITGLTAGTDYEIEIRANCSATSPGAFLTATTFTTGAPCCVPTGLTVGTVTGHTASVSWNSCLDAAWYNIRYRELPSGSWVGPFSATSPSYNITGLNLSTPYEFQVLTKCSATDISSWSIPQNFTTLAFRPSNDVNETNENFEDAIRMYPNPVGDMLHIQVTNSTSASTTIKVFDLSGRKIREVRANTQIGTNDLEIDMSNVSKGIYTIQIFEDEKLTHVSKITK